MHISSIEEILSDFKSGRFVILVDDQNRENEGDLMMAAEFVDAAKINFMLKEARGLICLTLSSLKVQQLQLPMLKSDLHKCGPQSAAFTYSIEASHGITTGISVKERAHTILTAIKESSRAADIVCPGHVFPLRAQDGGVLERAGHTEASIDLAKICNLNAAGIICEILDEEGSAANGSYLKKFSEKFNIKIGTVADLIQYRKTVQERR